MSEIKPIQTRYAGCHFRSRLEARWAVFFDALHIPWIYEPQGYDIDGTWYLPDFFLPHQRLWVEVKGTDNGLDLPLLLRAAMSGTGLPADPDGNAIPDPSRAGFRIIVLGPVPHATDSPYRFRNSTDDDPIWISPIHTALHFWKGDVTSGYAIFAGRNSINLIEGDFILGNDSGDVTMLDGQYPSVTNGGAAISTEPPNPDVVDAYRQARSARFEHGERGAA